MDEPTTLVSMRVADANRENVVAGSTQRPCAKCGEPVWVSPASASVTVDRTVCVPCAGPELIGNLRATLQVAPGAMQEVREHLNRN